MPNKHVPRAKLFSSFDSLVGFNEFIRKKERIIVERKTLLEDVYDLLEYKIHQIQKGDMIKVIYYDQNEYVQKEGIVSSIDLEFNKYIQIVKTKINLKDIVMIEFNRKELDLV